MMRMEREAPTHADASRFARIANRSSEAAAMQTVVRSVLIGWLALATGCESAGHFKVLGYSTRPNYSEDIRTVYVPQFKSQIFIDSTRQSIPVDVTRAVIREIESKTPFKVVSNPDQADTELTGTVMLLNKQLLNRNQLNEVREAETVLTAAIVWKDLRTGEILSRPRQGSPEPVTPGIPSLEIPDVGGIGSPPPVLPQPVVPLPGAPAPVLVTGTGYFIPEVGQSNITAYQQAINRLATQIVSQMEKPW